MGLFDHVYVNDDRFVCSEGHSLAGEEFQSKDFGCTMGDVTITGDRLEITDGGWGWDASPARPLQGRFTIYATCRRCPAFVQAGTFNLIDMGVTFEIEVVDDVIRAVQQVGPSTAEWLATEPGKPYMEGAQGPMTWEEALQMHRRRC